MAEKKNIKSAVSSAVNKNKAGFDLAKYKQSKNLITDSNKPESWLKVSDAFSEATGLKGIPEGLLTVIRGHSDTGKSALGLEAIVSAQKAGKLPVLIITEMKFSWEHARMMGFEFEEIADPETGEIISYEGNFIYTDLDQTATIEKVAEFMADLLDEQDKGKLPYDLVFLWDCAGTIPCQQSIDSKSQNNEWAAAAMSRNFGNYIDQRIMSSRKINKPYTNTFIVVNKIWVDKPATYGAMPTVKSKGGYALFSDAALVILFGNVTNSGTSKIKAQKDGREVEFAKRTRVSVEKEHIKGLTSAAKILITPHGFILDDKKQIDLYKKQHANEWATILGMEDFELIEEADKLENINDIQGEF
jgi:hypothetical protein